MKKLIFPVASIIFLGISFLFAYAFDNIPRESPSAIELFLVVICLIGGGGFIALSIGSVIAIFTHED